ncbi:MAG: flavin oxidoreductase/NADH oxidase [Clostridia bacterium]|nr:flavin oxidoreductase/NADH oxidase [Clostridia bacterium]
MAIPGTIEDLKRQAAELGLDFYCGDTAVLAQPCEVGGKTAPNRLVCQAMEGCDGTFDGVPGELTQRRYRRLAEGGAGVIWFEATAVMEEARANPRQLWLNEKNLDAFRRQTEAIREDAFRANGYAPLIVIQLTHSGRYSKPNGAPEPLIAYHNPIFEKNTPIADERIVTDDYLDRVGEALVNAAALAAKAGFDGADIKCCHRYLNCELLSAYDRPGRYGGSLENRTRLLRESIAGAMQVCPSEFLVSSRLNVYDGFPYPYGFGVSPEGGTDFDPVEPAALLRQLSAQGVKLLNITMGNPYFNPHVNRPFAVGPYPAPEEPLAGVARMLNGTAALKQAAPGIKLICSALSYLGPAAPDVAAGYIENGGFDFAGFGRTIFAYPDFARDILRTGGMKKEKCCICCSKCSEIMRAGSTPGCVIRDAAVYGPLYREISGKEKR